MDGGGGGRSRAIKFLYAPERSSFMHVMDAACIKSITQGAA
jgi:hypothetical protein